MRVLRRSQRVYIERGMVDALRKVDLYGGALTATVPSRMADISDFRPVPDNQEVFGDADIDQSLVIEVLERVEEGEVRRLDGDARVLFDVVAA